MTTPTVLGWWEDGEKFFTAALDRLDDDALDGPSLLPGWSRRIVVAHVARNADALVNLLTWARTGHETPMYPSPEARDAAITETAARPAADLRTDALAAADRLAAAVRQLGPDAWSREVRTAQGRTVPASEVLWMRCREAWVHAVDLDAGLGFGDMPDAVLAALIDDVHRTWQRRGEAPEVVLTAGARTWGAGTATVSGDLDDLAAWTTGRTPARAGMPALPAWL